MYQVYFDDYPLHDLRDKDLTLRAPDVHLAVGEAGSMSFTIDPDHPNADKLTRLKGRVQLYAGGGRIFRGRIRKDTRGFDLSREIEVEGLLACLNDSLIPPFNFPDDFADDPDYQTAADSGNVVQFFLGWVLQQHNSQVGAGQQITLGTVTVTDPNNYISRASSEYLTAMETVRKKLEGTLGGYLLADYSGDVTVLHYYADLPLTNVQEVTYGENLLDLVTELDSADTYTAILPVGAEGLTLDTLPDGQVAEGVYKLGRIVYSSEAETATGGRITHLETWKDVTLPSNLQSKAVALLTGEGVKTSQTITVKAVDLGPVESLQHFTVGRYVRLNSAPHGFSATYPLMELDPDIQDPGNTKITIGSTVKTYTGMTHTSQNASQERRDEMQLQLDKQAQHTTDLTTTVRTQVTEAVQTSEAIIFSALEHYVETSNYEEFRQTVAGQLEVLNDAINLTFTETTEQLNDVNGDLQLVVENLAKHFEFTADGLTIKAGDRSMTLELDNDIIRFVKNGQQFGWWDGVDFHTGNIVVQVNERAQFGNFAFVPRSNGSLSFLKVEG